jgi:hypothetical protein
MNTATELIAMERMKATLSTAWLFVLLNVVFRDLHELFRPGFLQEIMSGIVNGVQMTQETILLGSVAAEIPIAMVLLSRLLAYRVNRFANIGASVVTAALVFTNQPKDLDDVWFLAIVLFALLLIVWFAWRWRGVDAGSARAEAHGGAPK